MAWPGDTSCDWTIEIVARSLQAGTVQDGNEHVRAFLVHKDVLGKYSDKFFLPRLGNARRSRLELHPDAARAFPVLVEYIYFGTADLTAENAAALDYLGEYFAVPNLVQAVETFCIEDVTLDNAKTY